MVCTGIGAKRTIRFFLLPESAAALSEPKRYCCGGVPPKICVAFDRHRQQRRVYSAYTQRFHRATRRNELDLRAAFAEQRLPQRPAYHRLGHQKTAVAAAERWRLGGDGQKRRCGCDRDGGAGAGSPVSHRQRKSGNRQSAASAVLPPKKQRRFRQLRCQQSGKHRAGHHRAGSVGDRRRNRCSVYQKRTLAAVRYPAVPVERRQLLPQGGRRQQRYRDGTGAVRDGRLSAHGDRQKRAVYTGSAASDCRHHSGARYHCGSQGSRSGANDGSAPRRCFGTACQCGAAHTRRKRCGRRHKRKCSLSGTHHRQHRPHSRRCRCFRDCDGSGIRR